MDDLANKLTLIEQDIGTLSTKLPKAILARPQYEQAGEFLVNVRTRLKRIDDLRKFFTAPLNDQVKKVNNAFGVHTDKLKLLSETVSAAMANFADKERRAAEEEADRLLAEQEAKAEEERVKLEKLEAKRIAAEKAARDATDAVKKAALQAKAEAARQAEAEAVFAAEEEALKPVAVVATPVQTVRTAAGQFTAKLVTKWKVTDEKMLRKIHPELFTLDEKAVSRLVADGDVPAGVETYQTSEMATKR